MKRVIDIAHAEIRSMTGIGRFVVETVPGFHQIVLAQSWKSREADVWANTTGKKIARSGESEEQCGFRIA